MNCSFTECTNEADTATVEGWDLCEMHVAYIRSVSLNVDNPASEHTEETLANLLADNLPPALVECPTCEGSGVVESGL